MSKETLMIGIDITENCLLVIKVSKVKRFIKTLTTSFHLLENTEQPLVLLGYTTSMVLNEQLFLMEHLVLIIRCHKCQVLRNWKKELLLIGVVVLSRGINGLLRTKTKK